MMEILDKVFYIKFNDRYYKRSKKEGWEIDVIKDGYENSFHSVNIAYKSGFTKYSEEELEKEFQKLYREDKLKRIDRR